MNIEFNITPLKLFNKIRNYEWGTRGRRAFIPDLLGIAQEDDKPYAELWMGTHPNAPSQIDISGKLIDLTELINKYPQEILGKSVIERFGIRLPFLFKVLSAGQVLSIQTHPNLNQAKRLHRKDPIHYPDQNHKPEIAIALDKLTALVGLLNPSELNNRLGLYPEVQDYIGITSSIIAHNNHAINSDLVRRFYAGIIQKAELKPQIYSKLIESINNNILKRKDQISEQERLFLELKQQYPSSDIGLIMVLFMNLVHLKTEQALFTSAGVPHAYISGNIIECMTNSDNVVRIGLTNKFKDIPTLLDILDYSANSVDILDPKSVCGVITYQTPVEEFYVVDVHLNNKDEKILYTNDKVQIGIVISGQIELIWNSDERLVIKRGNSILIPASINKYVLRSQNKAKVFIATVN